MESKIKKKEFKTDKILDFPKDEEGYSLSFTSDQTNEIKNCFDTYGVVVIRDVLSKEECDRSVNDIWEYLEKQLWKIGFKSNCSVNRNDPNTWFPKFGWPSVIQEEGILGSPAVFTKAALTLRQHPTLHQIGSLLLKTEKVLVSHDRYGLFRPTKAPVENSNLWKTNKNIHTDMNPWTYFSSEKPVFPEEKWTYKLDGHFISEFNTTGHCSDGQVKIQGLFNFLDNKEKDGGFHCVPGMHRAMKEWSEWTKDWFGKLFSKFEAFIVLQWEDEFGYNQKDQTLVSDYAQRISSRAGSLILWNQLMPHGSAPNDSENVRMAQFLKLAPKNSLNEQVRKQRAKVINSQLNETGCEVTEIGKKLLGLDDLEDFESIAEKAKEENTN